jgi:uncharacterized protein HemX
MNEFTAIIVSALIAGAVSLISILYQRRKEKAEIAAIYEEISTNQALEIKKLRDEIREIRLENEKLRGRVKHLETENKELRERLNSKEF